MSFLISIIISILLVYIGRDFIKKHANLCYLITTIISIALVVVSFTNTFSLMPTWFTTTIFPILIKSTFSTAIFVIVMYTGAFKKGGKLIKFLMPIRAELSIIASILTLAHNISFGREHFFNLFNAPHLMTTNMKAAAGVSIILITVMIPLFITSFPQVRKLMKPKLWKNIQRFAYLFYAFIYFHVMLIMIPLALSGDITYIINVLVYNIVFITYAIMRIKKCFAKKPSYKPRKNLSIAIAN